MGLRGDDRARPGVGRASIMRFFRAAMPEQPVAFVTPSFAPDFERCALLAESFVRFVSPGSTHYVVVDRRDLGLFRAIEGPRTKLLTVEEIVPWWLLRLPLARRWWFSLRTPPVRNWILQQIVKLSIAEHLKEGAIAFTDSDVAFVRPFSTDSLFRDRKLRLLAEPGKCDAEPHRSWHRTAGLLLGLPPQDYFGANYIGNVVTWDRGHSLELLERLRVKANGDWRPLVCRQRALSEYVLYGVFVDHVLGERANHFREAALLSHDYWDPSPMEESELEKWFGRLDADHAAIMISAKAGMPASRYRPYVEAAWRSSE